MRGVRWWGASEVIKSEVVDKEMTYTVAMCALDMGKRAGEATHIGGGAEDHTTLCEDVVIHMIVPVLHEGTPQLSLRGGAPARLL